MNRDLRVTSVSKRTSLALVAAALLVAAGAAVWMRSVQAQVSTPAQRAGVAAPAAAPAAHDRHRAGHAAGARRAQPVQRNRERQVEPGGAGRPRAHLRAQPALERRLRDRPGADEGGRPLQGRLQPAARRAVMGPAHAVGDQQCRASHRWQPDADRPAHRQARARRGGRQPVQHVLLARRQVGHRGRRGAQAARLPRSADDGAAVLDRRAGLRRRQPRRLLDRRPVRDLHLRVRRHAGRRSIWSSARCWAT